MAITAIATDTGSSSSDFITNDTSLTVSGTNGALPPGEKIQVSSDGGTTWTDVVQNGTTWSLVDTTSHPSSFTYQARIVDTAGNIGTTASQAVTIDTAAPAEALAITAIASDTGSSSSDFITSDTTLTVSGTNGALRPGEKIQVSSDGGTTWTDVVQNSTSWSLVDPTAHPSSFTYQARIVDTAGNIGTTASQAITIDTTAPAEALAITAIASDTGSSSSDFITNDTSLTVSGTNGALSAGEKIQVSSDGGTTWTDVVQNGTTWSLVDATAHPSSFTYQARIVDAAGNIGTTASHAVTIDTTAPAEALAITAIAANTRKHGYADGLRHQRRPVGRREDPAQQRWWCDLDGCGPERNELEPGRWDRASVELYLSGADHRHRRQHRHYRQPSFHWRKFQRYCRRESQSG